MFDTEKLFNGYSNVYSLQKPHFSSSVMGRFTFRDPYAFGPGPRPVPGRARADSSPYFSGQAGFEPIFYF